MALTGSSSPHFYLARSRSTSLPPVAKSSTSHLASGGNGTSFPFSSSSSPSSASWPSSMLPCLALAFDEPSFFADLRIDINPLTTSSTTSSTTLSSCASSSMSTQNGGKASSTRPSSRTSSGEGPEDLGVGGDVGRTSLSSSSSAASSSSSVVWVHRMVLAVHSPVFRSLLRDTGGSREAREGVIDMRGSEHPPGAVVRCMLKMMYASPGLAIDELGKEPKLSDEWEFLLQLFKLAHLYQVEVVLDACTRRIKHILERKDLGGSGGVHPVGGTRMRRRRSSSAKSPSSSTAGGNNSLKDVEEDLLLAEEEDERMRQTCYALELLAFLLHVKEAETRSSSSSTGGDGDENDNTDSSNDVDLRRVHKNWQKAAEDEMLVGVEAKSPTMPPRSGEAGTAGEDVEQVGLPERREEMLVRLLDQHLYPQLLTIVQHIRCEDVLTLQHLLQLSVCRPLATSPVSPPPAWPGGPGARTSHVKPHQQQQHHHGGSS